MSGGNLIKILINVYEKIVNLCLKTNNTNKPYEKFNHSANFNLYNSIIHMYPLYQPRLVS